jgi:DNA-directed RNA polymerase subunit L
MQKETLTFGKILRMTLEEADGMKLAYGVKDRDKYVVVIGISTDYALVGSLLINSKINTTFKNTKDLQNCQLPLKKADYFFLKHDSYLDCSSILRPMLTKVLANAEDVSELTTEDKSIVKQLLSDSTSITPKDKKRYNII